MTTWQDIWTKKASRHAPGDYSLAALMELDGYDISCSHVNEQDFIEFAKLLVARLGIAPGASVLEIGCGAGALCKALSDMGFDVAGVDYTPGLIDICKEALPNGKFYVGEGALFDLPKKDYDAVISHSVFHYFPSTPYALDSFRRMAAHCRAGGIVALTDMHDVRLKEEHETRRKAMIGEEEYNRLYAELKHSFYHPDDFVAAADVLGAESSVEEQFLRSNSGRFKFNFFARLP